MNDEALSRTFVAAHLWQSRGWQVLPAQPNSKWLVQGFGVYLKKAETGEEVKYWFQDRSSNLAVVAPEDGGVVLDFDDIEVYFQFCRRWPELALSYTEATPRTGRHLFLMSSERVPPGLVLVKGAEAKRCTLVYPSRVGGGNYQPVVYGPILLGNVLEALQPFIARGVEISPAPPAIQAAAGRPVPKLGHKKDYVGYIEELKAGWPILEYLRFFEPELVLTGHGRWLTGRCVWHNDSTPSLWVDVERNHWGCHACHIGGDILDWHKRRLETNDLTQVVRDLMSYKVGVEG